MIQDGSEKVLTNARRVLRKQLANVIPPHLDPLVGNRHLEAVIETHATLLPRPAECRHTTYILSHSDACGKEVVKEVVDLQIEWTMKQCSAIEIQVTFLP